jgi:phosphoribosylformimino-5-aminoimidazole carboxamide ribotide isomerase
VIGTRAVDADNFVGEVVQAFGEKIAVGIDAKNGIVAVKGWVASSGMSALEAARRMDVLGVRTLIHTDIGTDGMLTGPNFEAQEAMLRAGKFHVIASGGVSSRDDVVKLAELARRYANLDGAIVGKALYEKRVDLPDLIAIAR